MKITDPRLSGFPAVRPGSGHSTHRQRRPGRRTDALDNAPDAARRSRPPVWLRPPSHRSPPARVPCAAALGVGPVGIDPTIRGSKVPARGAADRGCHMVQAHPAGSSTCSPSSTEGEVVSASRLVRAGPLPVGSHNRYRAVHLRQTGRAMQPDMQQPPTNADAPAPAMTRDWKRWAVPVATLIIGIGVGAASASADPTQSEEYRAQSAEYQELEAELATAQDRITVMSKRAGDLQAGGEKAIREAAEREAELDGRAAELDEKAAELATREQAAPAARPAPAPSAPAPPAPPVARKPDGNVAQSNALGKARDYLKFTSFSRSGLIEQLQYEGFSTGDATWAVDNLAVDWNEQAAKKAEEYLSFTSFSRSGLIEQLTYEGFSPQQAEHGANTVGL